MGLLDVRNSIIANLESGKSREDIFTESMKENSGQAAKIAFAIASVPYQELRQKYMFINGVLFLSLLGLAAVNLIAELPIDFEKTTIFIFLRVVIPLVLSYFVYHFHGGIYRLLGFWCVFDLTEHVILANFASAAGLIKLTLLVVVIFLSFRIALKVFPNLTFIGPKQDNLGRYLL